MSGELTIRPAHSEDAAAILAYLRQIGAESDNLTFGPEGLPITEEQERQYLRQVENDPDALMLVAQEADEIVALCGLLRPRRPRMSHRAQIDASVRKSHWNHGIATRMLTELLETGVRAGVTAFTLEVRADNAAAVHVYEKLGFRTVGRLERFFRINGQYHAAWLMGGGCRCPPSAVGFEGGWMRWIMNRRWNGYTACRGWPRIRAWKIRGGCWKSWGIRKKASGSCMLREPTARAAQR